MKIINKKKLFQIVFIILALFTATFAAFGNWMDHANTNWYNVDFTTFTIDTPAKLAGVSKLVNDGVTDFSGKILEIDRDLDLSAYDWVPIGNQDRPFRGTMVSKGGNIYKLSGMIIKSKYRDIGLIGYMQNATVGGFDISGFITVDSSDDTCVGVVVGRVADKSTVFNVINNTTVNITVSKSVYAGGIVGTGSGIISNATNNGAITVNATNAYVGGVAGSTTLNTELKLKNTSNFGDISTSAADTGAVGGIVGRANANLIMAEENTNIANSGKVSVAGDKAYCGGILGYSTVEANVAFSNGTSNSGNITIISNNSSKAYAGSLTGLFEKDLYFDFNYSNTGTVTNNAKTNTYTGGLVGGVNGKLVLNKNFTNSANVNASGTEFIYTGSVAGYVYNDIIVNSSVKNDGEIKVTASTSRIFTGGLFGATDGKLQFNSIQNNAYSNNGNIIVTGKTDIYTGGIISNKAYTKKANNVTSTGNITVRGDKNLYTGGFIGYVAGEDANISGETYTSTINVNANPLENNDFNSRICTGGIVGLYEKTGVIDHTVFKGIMDVTGGKYTYTGGIVGYSQGSIISNAEIGNVKTNYSSISSTGYVGGIAGYTSGSVDKANAGFININAKGENGFIGGIAGKAKGTIQNVTLGVASYANNDSVKIQALANAVLAGGIAGENDEELVVASSNISRIEIKSGNSNEVCSLGGIIGHASDKAVLGSSIASLNINNITIISNGDHSNVGGVIGDNNSKNMYITAQGLTLGSNNKNAFVGGIAGKNSAVSGIENIVLLRDVTIKANGTDSIMGGVFGKNTADIENIEALNINIISNGQNSKAGGMVGDNTGKLTALKILNPNIESNGADSSIGLLVGCTQGDISYAKIYADEGKNPVLTSNSSNSNVGGIVGYAVNSNILGDGKANNITNALISTANEAAGNKAGGIVGKSSSAVVTQVINDSPIISVNGENSLVGGIAGETSGKIENIKIYKPIITANGISSKIGGIVGFAENEIIDVQIIAEDPDYSVIIIKGAATIVGGIAGETSGTLVSGNGIDNNVENLTITVTETATGTSVGGFIGDNKNTKLNKIHTKNIKITDNAPNSTVGGMTGYNKGSHSAIIADNYTSEIKIIVNETSVGSTIGGIVGLNDARDGGIDDEGADKALSSIQNNRSIGSITVYSLHSKVGGLVGENKSVIANNSISDKLTVISQGDNNIVGGLIGRNTKTVYFSYSNAVMTIGGSETIAGGLVGENTGLINSSYIERDISGVASGTQENYAYLGGLVGKNSGDIEKSHTSSKVSANGEYSCVGGLVGWHDGGMISNSYAARDVVAKASDSFAGGFLGRITLGRAANSYSAGLISGENGAYAGCFAGRYDTLDKELFKKCYYVKDEGKGLNSGLLDFAAGEYYELNLYMRLSPILSDSLADRNSFLALSGWMFDNKIWKYGSPNAEYRYPELVRIANSGDDGGKPPVNLNINIDWYTKDKTAIRFMIGTEAELAGLSAIVNGNVVGLEKFNFDGRIIEISAPIHIQSDQWTPIGNNEANAFEGSFNGRNNLISGLKVEDNAFAGLFGVIGNKAKVSNVRLEPVSSIGNQLVGALAGLNRGNITNTDVKLINSAAVAGGINVGGVIGKNEGNLENIKVSIDATSVITSNVNNAIVGGVVGYTTKGNGEKLSVVFNDGKIRTTGFGSITGGIIGKSDKENIISAVSISANNTTDVLNIIGNGIVGGIIGEKTGNEAAVFDVFNAIVENATIASNNSSTVGGIIGKLTNAAIQDAVFKGKINISADNVIVGGVVGDSVDSIIYKTEVIPAIVLATTNGESLVGAITGRTETTVDKEFNFGKMLPLYRGINLSIVKNDIIKIAAADNNADVYVGGVVGKNIGSSIYNLRPQADIAVTGAKTANIGGITGLNEGSIVNCIADGNIKASECSVYNVGGAIGFASGADVKYSSVNAGNIIEIGSAKTNTGVTPATHIGGFIGKSENTIIRNAYADTKIEVSCENPYNTLYVGGFAGLLEKNTNGLIQGAYSKGSIAASGKAGSYVGGFAGDVNNYTIREAYSAVDVSNKAFDARSGGFAGVINHNSSIEKAYSVQDSVEAIGASGATRAYAGGFAGYNNGSLIEAYASVSNVSAIANGSNSYVGSFIGYNFRDGKVNNSYYTGPVGIKEGGAGQALKETDFSTRQMLESWDFSSNNAAWSYIEGMNNNKPVLKNVSSWTFDPDISFMTNAAPGNAFTVSNEKQLGAVVLLSNDLEYYKLFSKNASQKPVISKVILGNDLDLSTGLWMPFKEFKGEFDGDGKKINGINYYGDAYDGYGFVETNKGTIRNVTFENTSIVVGTNSGIVAGLNDESANISNVGISGTLVGYSDFIGGVSGINNGVISGILAETVNISGQNHVAGIAGKTTVAIENIKLTGKTVITAEGDFAGAVAGESSSDLTNIITGDIKVSGTQNIGGIAGKAAGINTVNTGDISITAVEKAGGIAGEADSVNAVTTKNLTVKGDNTIGGVSGKINGQISGVKAGNVVVEGNIKAAGIVPEASNRIEKIELASVNVKGTDYVAGITGKTTEAIENVKITGKTVIVAEGDFAGAVAGESSGDITNVTTGDIEVSGEQRIGGIAGKAANINMVNAGDISIAAIEKAGGIAGEAESIVTVTTKALTVKGNSTIGGIAGTVAGDITDITLNGATNVVAVGNLVAGIVGEGAGNIAVSGSGDIKVTSSAGNYIGGIAGKATGSAITVNDAGNIEVSAYDYVGGIAGENHSNISAVKVKRITVNGNQYVGGIAGKNNGMVDGITLKNLTLSGEKYMGGVSGQNQSNIKNTSIETDIALQGDIAGGITGKNEGNVENVSFKGNISGKGNVIGGIAGENAGQIKKSYAKGSIGIKNSTLHTIAGGLTGKNNSTIEESFSMVNIYVKSDTSNVGGLAGENEGTITDSFNSGDIHSDGESYARAGGITGYALNGIIKNVLNYGQVEAEIDGKLIYGRTYYGGIAGQVANGVTIKNTFYDRQMLKESIAYNNAAGNFVKAESGKTTGYKTNAFVNEALPEGMNEDIWQAVRGFYPQIKHFDGVGEAKLAAVAVILDNYDTVYNVMGSYTLTNDGAISWDTRRNGNEIQLTAVHKNESRIITINKKALMYNETAQGVSGLENKVFDNTIDVVLTTTEPGGRIYYTLDGKQPTEDSLPYTEKITLLATTTVKAIVLADGKNNSESVQAIYTKKQSPGGGDSGGATGGSGIIVIAKPAIEISVGGKVSSGINDGEKQILVAKNSKVKLTAPEDHTIYYTTDGSTPTKNSLKYTGEFLVDRNIVIKAITDKNNTVITMAYNIENAKFNIREKANETKYIKSASDKTFRPDEALTRADLIDSLDCLLDTEKVDVGTKLSDVAGEQKDLIAKFESAGIIQGYEDGTFGGEKGITRAEFVTVMTKVLKLEITENGESKLSDISGHWSEKYVNAFVKAGYIKGYTDGTFRPDHQISRAEAVALINRIIGVKKQNQLQKYEDLTPAHWAYDDIMTVVK